jgi:hypothetical protein
VASGGMHKVARRVKRAPRGTRVAVVITTFLVLLAAAAAFDLPGYLVAVIGAMGVLVAKAEQWLVARLGQQRAQHRRAPGITERADLLALLRDQVAGDLATRLSWTSLLGAGDPSLPYKVVPPGGADEDAEAAEPLKAEEFAVQLQRDRETALLGPGGTGKSTLLRLLQRQLVEIAAQDVAAPVPVLLDASRWTREHGSFADWISQGVDELYRVPRGVVQHMLGQSQLVLLLDGIDELSTGERESAAEALRAMLDEIQISTVVASRPEKYAEVRPALHMIHEVLLAALDGQAVRDVLDEAPHDAGDGSAWADFVDTPYKLKMAVVTNASSVSVHRNDNAPPASADLIATYVQQRLEDTSRSDYGRPFSASDVWALEWVAAHMRENASTHVNPDAIPYEWAPANIRSAVLIGVPAALGAAAGAVALLWVQPVAAALVTAMIWLSYTTDADFWFGRSPRTIKAASALSAISAAGFLYLFNASAVLVGIALITAWVHRSKHYAPRYVTAAALTSAAAAAAAQLAASLTTNAALVALLGGLAWFVALVLAGAVSFVPCGRSLKYHRGIEGTAPEGPEWLVGSLTGADVARLAAALSILPVLAVCVICAVTNVAVGTGIAALVAPACTLFMVHVAMVFRGQVVDHQLPVSIRYPLWTVIWLSPLVLLLDDPWKAVLAGPVLLELYLAVTFIRGSDFGMFRTTEGGAFVRQLVYRHLLARCGILPVRLRQLFDRASSRLIMQRTGTGVDQYAFEHLMVRDHLADNHMANSATSRTSDREAATA